MLTQAKRGRAAERESPGPTVMVADNDPDFLEIAREFLQLNGYDVVCATTPAEASRHLRETPMAIAFLDLRLVNDDDERDNAGLRVALDTIEGSSVPKVILTKFDRAEYARESLMRREHDRVAAVDFLIKQNGLHQMVDAIERNLNRARVFLSYAKPDQPAVALLYDMLAAAGYRPWMGEKSIVGGMKWEFAIRDAIRESDFFVVCLSQKSVVRRSFFQKEIRMALKVFDEMLEDDIYLIPLRLEDCDITHPLLEHVQWVDMFGELGFQRLVQSIREGLRKRGHKQDLRGAQ